MNSMTNAHHVSLTREHFAVNRSSLLHSLKVVKPSTHSKSLIISIAETDM